MSLITKRPGAYSPGLILCGPFPVQIGKEVNMMELCPAEGTSVPFCLLPLPLPYFLFHAFIVSVVDQVVEFVLFLESVADLVQPFPVSLIPLALGMA